MKPECKLLGENGNIFNLAGITARCLRRAGLRDEAKEFAEKIVECNSYEEALQLIMEYVEVQ